ncbi:Lysine-specific demethylase 6A, partial [Ceratobasidium sp. 423]
MKDVSKQHLYHFRPPDVRQYTVAKDAYERVPKDSPNHAKVFQQLGWLYHQAGAPFANKDTAIVLLTKSLESAGIYWAVPTRFYRAYQSYQQTVYGGGCNPTFWCSTGGLYYIINKFRDAPGTYSRAIRINPYITKVSFDLGSPYESCNNQISGAIDAYARTVEPGFALRNTGQWWRTPCCAGYPSNCLCWWWTDETRLPSPSPSPSPLLRPSPTPMSMPSPSLGSPPSHLRLLSRVNFPEPVQHPDSLPARDPTPHQDPMPPSSRSDSE